MGSFKNQNIPNASSLNLNDESVRKELSAPSFKIFLGVADKWELNVAERTKLLGSVPSATYFHWKKNGVNELSHDQLERLSLILGIWKALRLLFTDVDASIRWLKAKNSDMPFSGNSPLNTMLRGSIDDLYSVRRYLDGWRGIWP